MIAHSLLSVVLLFHPVQLPKLVGTLSVSSGKVRLERNGTDPQWAGRYSRLRIGDKLTVVEMPKATLRMDLTRETFRLPEKGIWQIQERTVKTLEGAAPILLYREKAMRSAAGVKPPTLAGRIRGGDAAVSPFGSVISGPITVTWNQTFGATRVKLELLDGQAKAFWSSEVSNKASYTLPTNVLKPGKWIQVRVTQIASSTPIVSSSWLRILTQAERQSIESSEKEIKSRLASDAFALGMALGDLYASFSLVSRFENAIAISFPDAQGVHEIEATINFGRWLEIAGFTGIARTRYEQAWAAGERDDELKDAIERVGGIPKFEEWDRLLVELRDLREIEMFADAIVMADKLIKILRNHKKLDAELALAICLKTHFQLQIGAKEFNEDALREAEAIYQRTHGSNSMELAKVFMLQAEVAFKRKLHAIAKKKSEDALDIWQKLSPVSEQVATLLFNVGIAAKALGDVKEAQSRLEQSVSVWAKVAPNSIVVAYAHRQLGNIAWDKGQKVDALRWYESSVDATRNAEGESLYLAENMRAAGATAYALSDFNTAKKHYETAAQVAQRLNPNTALVAGYILWLGKIAEVQRNFDEAERQYEATLSIYQKLDPFSNDTALTLSLLGAIELLRGDYVSSKQFRERALAIYQKKNPKSIEVGRTLNLLGVIAWNQGDLTNAQQLYESAISICQSLEPKSSLVAQILFNLGVVASDRGDYLLAKVHHEAALAIYEKLGTEPMKVADQLNALGNNAMALNNLDEAERLLRAGLEIRATNAPESDLHAMSLLNLGVLAQKRGDLNESLKFTKAANEIYQRHSKITAYPNLGELALRLGDLDEAERLYEFYLGKLRIAALPVASMREAVCLEGLAESAKIRGDNVKFAQRFQEWLSLINKLAVEVGPTTRNEISKIGEETSNVLRKIDWLQFPQSQYSWVPTLRSAGLTIQIRAKAIKLELQGDEQMRKAESAVLVSTKQETDWTINPRPENVDEKTWSDRLLELSGKRQSAELKLATLLKEKNPRLAEDLTISFSDVQRNLAKEVVLVEYLRVRTWNKSDCRPGPDSYAAFVVRNHGDVEYIRLGDAQAIDEMVEQWHTQIAFSNDPNASEAILRDTQKQLRLLGRRLFDQIIKPLGKLQENVMIAPDSSLHSLPFGALVDGKGRYLAESVALSCVSSGRDLVEKPLKGEPRKSAVIANPDFGANAKIIGSASVNRSGSQELRSVNARGEWSPLPSAEIEGEEVAKLLDAIQYKGKEAIEDSLLNLVRPRVLHIATHGFFFPKAGVSANRESFLTNDIVGRGMRAADNPMLRSGLILAGANNDDELRSAGLADGWATALEISQMDLRGTELVVLSACDTGRGDSIGSEGLFGLQRAFRFAGAQSLIVSLFKVPDASTQKLMTTFYRIWKPGDPEGKKLRALRDTQLAMIRDPKTRHPRHWSAFVLLGER